MIDSTPVLSEKEYHNLYKEAFHWSNVIQLQALARTTCFFIGLSMNDPNLRRLLDISRNGISSIDQEMDKPCHYAIIERKSLSNVPNAKKDKTHFELQERIMAEFGIIILWFKQGNFKEIPRLIKYIREGI